MAFWQDLVAKLAPRSAQALEPEPPTSLVYVVLPEPLDPLDRASRYKDPLEAELALEGIGFVSGGGTSLGPEQPDGSRAIQYCGVDAFDVDAARALLRLHLPELGCIAGTQLQYRNEADDLLLDEFDGREWRLGLARAAIYPDFLA